MKNKFIVFVSPGGTSIKARKVKLIAVFIITVFVVCGFSAYFIPYEKFRFKTADVKQKQRISNQNELLYRRIVSALGMLNRLKRQIVPIDAKKERVAELAGAKAARRNDAGPPSENTAESYAGMNPEELLEQTVRLDSQFMSFAVRASLDNENPFNNIPVCKPTPDYAVVSLRFGKTRDPFTGALNWHRGIDLAAAEGTPVVAAAAGRVARVDNDAVWGNRIVIVHSDGISTVYAHIGTLRTAKGSTVKRGEVIGTIGYSGLTTGPHVHFEIWRNGVAVDPETYFYPVQMTKKQLCNSKNSN